MRLRIVLVQVCVAATVSAFLAVSLLLLLLPAPTAPSIGRGGSVARALRSALAASLPTYQLTPKLHPHASSLYVLVIACTLVYGLYDFQLTRTHIFIFMLLLLVGSSRLQTVICDVTCSYQLRLTLLSWNSLQLPCYVMHGLHAHTPTHTHTHTHTGWPWGSTAQTFPLGKGRFALQNGVETHPPVAQCAPEEMTIKALKEAIARAGLTPQSLGFSEKREFVELLLAHQNKQ